MTMDPLGVVECLQIFEYQSICMIIVADFEAIQPFALDQWMKWFNAGIIPWISLCTIYILAPGDTERDDEDYKGHYFINANSTTPPQIVDKYVKPILDRNEIYSGCYARVSLNRPSFIPSATWWTKSRNDSVFLLWGSTYTSVVMGQLIQPDHSKRQGRSPWTVSTHARQNECGQGWYFIKFNVDGLLRGDLDDAAGAFEVQLTDSDIDYLEEMYVPHPIVGAIKKNPQQGFVLLDEKR